MRLRLPCEAQTGTEVGQIGFEGRAILTIHINLGPGVGDAAFACLDTRIEILQTIVAFCAAAKDIPPQTGGDGEGWGGAPGVLDKRTVVGAGLGGEQVLGEVGVVI